MKDSPCPWLSFVFDLDEPLTAAPTPDDVGVSKFALSADGTFDLELTLNGLTMGETPFAWLFADAFKVDGSSALGDGFAADNLSVVFSDNTDDGKIRLTARPKSEDTNSFFVRVRLNP